MINEKDKEDNKNCLLRCLAGLLLILIIPAIFLEGWVLSNLWLWFIVPLGIKQIGLFHAVGLSTLLSLFYKKTTSSQNPDKDKAQVLGEGIGIMIIYPLIILLMGYLIHLGM